MKVETAIILAGGKSRRMGRDKWSLPWKGKTFLEHLYWELASYFNRVLVSAREDVEIPFQKIPDIVEAGSMGGIYSTLVNIGEPAFFCAVDMPLMRGEVARKIADFYSDEWDVVVPRIGGRFETLAAVYSPSVISAMKEQILAGNFRIRDLFEKVRVRIVEECEIGENAPEIFINVNTLEDYEKLTGRELR